MPPRIPLCQCLRASNIASQRQAYTRPFTSSSSNQASTRTQKRRHQDPYALAQAKARKAANVSRQEVLKKERASALGDPIRGTTTPYLRSFDHPTASDDAAETTPEGVDHSTSTESDGHLNYLLSTSELERGLEYSQWLSTPSSNAQSFDDGYTDEKTDEQRAADVAKQQANAAEALRRISNLSLGSSQDRMRVNIQRCVSDFGRHNTDATLPPRPASQVPLPENQMPKTPRTGPDTGSSEVQIAILTAKIRTLADFLETRGTMDKANKRNLRLLIHRRAKLLNYLRRKERGGPRFQNVVEKLGLTEGTWKGEITLMGALGGHSDVRLAKLQSRTAA